MKLTNCLLMSTLLATYPVTLIGVSPTVSASPDHPAAVQGCHYSLTSRLIALPDEAPVITASFTPTECGSGANVNDLTVCLWAPDGRSDCARRSGWGLVEITLPVAHTPGTFTATGKGCFIDVLSSMRPTCETAGPVSATV